ncbi:hypothetical protein PENTCL1PPCAC_20421, partial [Pristionchus entomophagus]
FAVPVTTMKAICMLILGLLTLLEIFSFSDLLKEEEYGPKTREDSDTQDEEDNESADTQEEKQDHCADTQNEIINCNL